jgi:hypothetical protein
MSGCRGCLRTIANGGPKIVVQFADATSGVYCRDCGPRLQGLGRSIDDARALRKLLASGWKPKKMLTDEDL